MIEKILELLNTISEEEQNNVIEEIVKALRQQRLKKFTELEKEARRIQQSTNNLNYGKI